MFVCSRETVTETQQSDELMR